MSYLQLVGSLCDAISRGDKSSTQKYLDQGVDVNAQHRTHISALAVASLNGDVDMIELLVNAGADVNMQLVDGKCNEKFGSALAAACFAMDKSSMVVLLHAGADTNQRLLRGPAGNAVSMAIIQGDFEKIKLLLESGALLGPLSAYLIRRMMSQNSNAAETLQDLRRLIESHDPGVASMTIKWEIPKILKHPMSFNPDRLGEHKVLVRKGETVKWTTICDFLIDLYGNMGRELLKGVDRAIECWGKHQYDQSRME